MIRSVLGKLLWMARATSTVVGLAIMLALVVGVASAGFGATGGNFILGKANSAGAVSKLTASVAGPALQLVNQSGASGATALGLNVASGKPPLKVNATAGKATNLNADKLDGLHAAQLAGTGDSSYRGSASICNPNNVPFTDTLPVSVDRQSLLFATGRAGVQANGNANVSTIMDLELRNAENTTTLARTGFSSQSFSANSLDTRDLVSEGVLKSGISSPSEAPFVLQPGVDYVLRMTVSLNGGTCTGTPPLLWSSSLSYIQLGRP
jgi:hypothetical protein